MVSCFCLCLCYCHNLNLSFVRNALLYKHFRSYIVSDNQLKKHKDYKHDYGLLKNQVVLQKDLLSRTLEWLSGGLSISEQWIVYVPGDAVQNYLNFRQGTSNTFINAPPQGAPQLINTSNAPRIQGVGDADNLVVEGVHRLRITEFEEM